MQQASNNRSPFPGIWDASIGRRLSVPKGRRMREGKSGPREKKSGKRPVSTLPVHPTSNKYCVLPEYIMHLWLLDFQEKGGRAGQILAKYLERSWLVPFPCTEPDRQPSNNHEVCLEEDAMRVWLLKINCSRERKRELNMFAQYPSFLSSKPANQPASVSNTTS